MNKVVKKRSLCGVGSVPAGGIVIVADIIKVSKRARSSIMLVKMKVSHLKLSLDD